MAGSQPLSLQELHARISRLENDITHIRSEYLQVKNENNQLKYEFTQLKNELWRLMYRQSVSEERLDGMEPRVQEIMRRIAATSLGGGGFNSVGDVGSGWVAFNNNFHTNEAGNLSGVLGGSPFKSQVGADGSGASQNVPPLPGTGASYTTINPALLGQPSYPLLSGLDSGANPGISLPYSGGHASSGHGRQLAQQYWTQNASQNNPGNMYPVDSGSGHQQVSIPETGAASFAHNAPTVMLTNQASPRFPISNSPGASGRRAPLGAMFLVPHLTSPLAQAARRERHPAP
ncbi:hypothetical protein FRC01_014317 [Tulasnella sp. 417]|nr:hypothetical protein FRC01_014317 [Tulasnella sp. 417]